MSGEHFGWDLGADGVLLLTMDAPGKSANTMDTAFQEAFHQLPEIMAANLALKKDLRRLETLGRPVAAAINGAALGGGLEIALSCHHRVALDAKGSEIGFPEVTLGLLPGAGGVVRSVRLLGITDALLKVLLQGQRYKPKAALENDLVHEVVATAEEMLAAAKTWVLANPEAKQPWDVAGYKIPGGDPKNPKFAANLPAFPANLRKQLKGAPYPAPRAILAAAVEGARVDVDNAGLIEARYFVELATGQVAKNMTQAFFFDMQTVNGGGFRPAGYEPWHARKVAVLGAGMMGAGIAYACARAGIEVVLKDVSAAAAEKGKAYSATILDKAVARGTSTREAADAVLARIHPTAEAADTAGADLVIEAVFESPELKAKVFGEIEGLVAPDALLGSNTSTLPITGLAEAVQRPEDFIGLHFFSPVDKMPLLEIVVGAKTSDAAVARAVDLARQIKKTPIVVNDHRGFFTSRVISRFLDEAMAMLGEGANPASIEQAGLQAGYPAAPLQLMDELTLTLPRKIREETKAATLVAGGEWATHGSEAVVDRMIDEFGRGGRASGAGFYEYADGKRTGLWPGLIEHFAPGSGAEIPFDDMKERMLFAEALDSVRCLDEGVLRSVAEANIGSLLGIGFPAWTGGVLQYISGYDGGPAGFVARATELRERYGSVFEVPASLAEKARRGERYE